MLLITILNVPYNKVLASSYTQLVVNTSKKKKSFTGSRANPSSAVEASVTVQEGGGGVGVGGWEIYAIQFFFYLVRAIDVELKKMEYSLY